MVRWRFQFFMIAALVSTGVPALAEITRAPLPTLKSNYTVVSIAKGLSNPWGLQFLPGGRMIVTERSGQLRIVDQTGKLSSPVRGVPDVAEAGQGGLLDIALDPNFATNSLVYMSFAEPRGSGRNGTSVARGMLVIEANEVRLDQVRVIFRQEPSTTGGLHFGSRLAFADDGTLFVTLGERYQRDFAQDTSRHWGKVVRINTDGSIPGDNPNFGANAAPGLWSIGHRNPQSAGIHPTSRKLWVVEHGPQGGDEINISIAGANYGWPLVGYGIDYSGANIHASTKRPGLEQPIYYWTPSIAPSGMAFYTGDKFPNWKGNLFVGALAGQHLARLVLDGETIIAEERLLENLNHRIRDVRQGPDGLLYVLTDSARGEILRLIPSE